MGHLFPTHPDWTMFSLKEVMHRHEEHFLELALKDASGRVTRAAQLLGLPGHQTLLSILTRHKNLLKARTPATPRRQGIIRHGGEPRRSRRKTNRKARKAKILHVEDDSAVAGMIKESLASEDCEVEVCADFSMALKKIAGYARYDLLMLDYDLLGANGEKLVRQARQLHHRRRTPIVVLSSMLDEESVRITGVDAFLRKPEDVMAVAETVGGLLGPRKN
jgi:CheY-like chemotaxis protein